MFHFVVMVVVHVKVHFMLFIKFFMIPFHFRIKHRLFVSVCGEFLMRSLPNHEEMSAMVLITP